MDKTSILRTLREHQNELRATGVLHLRLFGSVARGDVTFDSDIDLLADFDRSRRLSLIGLIGLENRLSDLLGAKVDLSPADTMKPPVRVRAERDAVHAF